MSVQLGKRLLTVNHPVFTLSATVSQGDWMRYFKKKKKTFSCQVAFMCLDFLLCFVTILISGYFVLLLLSVLGLLFSPCLSLNPVAASWCSVLTTAFLILAKIGTEFLISGTGNRSKWWNFSVFTDRLLFTNLGSEFENKHYNMEYFILWIKIVKKLTSKYVAVLCIFLTTTT